jgi:type IV pilus assembly protein PilW
MSISLGLQEFINHADHETDKHMLTSVKKNSSGLTLVELMVALAVGTIVLTLIVGSYAAQQRSYVKQQLIVDMQQNARAALAVMKGEIRMAGYNPAASDGIDNDLDLPPEIDEADESANAGFITAQASSIHFKMDLYKLANPTWATDGLDNDGDGAIDEWDECYDMATDSENEDVSYRFVANRLLRDDVNKGLGPDDLAYDIDAVAFAYAFDSEPDGQLDTSPNDFVVWAFDSDGDDLLDRVVDTNDDGLIDNSDAAGGAALATPVSLDRIRAVRIWLLARTRHPLSGYSDKRTYVVGSQRFVSDDEFKRMLLSVTVSCRNMGI